MMSSLLRLLSSRLQLIFIALTLTLTWMQPVKSSPQQSMYDATGSLAQLEFADRAARRGGTVAAAHSDNCAILLAWSPQPRGESPRQRKKPMHKIRALAQGIGFSATGLASDVLYVANMLHDEAQEHTAIFGSPAPAKRLAASLGDELHARTLSQALRPLGVRCCLVSWDKVLGANVVEIDTEGNVADCTQTAFGVHGARLRRCLSLAVEESGGGKGKDEGEALLRACLDAVVRCSRQIIADSEATTAEAVKLGKGADADEQLRQLREAVSLEVDVAVVGRDLPFSLLDRAAVRRALQLPV